MMLLYGKSVRHGLNNGSLILQCHPITKMISFHIENEGFLDYNLTSNKKQTIKEINQETKKQINGYFIVKLNHSLELTNYNKKFSLYKKQLTHAEQDIQILKLKVLLMGIKHLQRCNSQLGQ